MTKGGKGSGGRMKGEVDRERKLIIPVRCIHLHDVTECANNWVIARTGCQE